MTPLKATSVQFSGVMPGGHASASFEVAVENAYLMPPVALREGSWVVIYDDAHELWEGEILSVKPSVDDGGHKLSVEGGGLMNVASKRQDLSQMWVHRGADGWVRRPGTPDGLGSFSTDKGLSLRVPTGTTEAFNSAAITSQFSVIFALDDLVTDQTISYVSWVGTVDTLTNAGVLWYARIDALPEFGGAATVLDTKANASGAWTNAVAPPAGTREIMVLLYSGSGAYTVTADKFAEFTQFDIYSSGRTTKARIDEAMVDLAVKPGIALSYTSKPVGPAMDDLRVGGATSKTSVAGGLEELAAFHAQPFDWGFWDNRAFDVRPRLITPDNDARVVVVGGGRPGLVSWDVADYDEDVPDYACVLFGNKDSASYPEAWPRRVYRPTTPPDDNVKLVTLDFSGTILTDAAAAALGDNVVGRAPAEIPPDYVLRVHPQLAKEGTWPGNNDDPTTVYQDISDGRATGTLAGNPVWAGSNSPADPACLTFDGTGDYVTFGDLAALDLGTGPRSVSVWFKLDALAAASALLAKRSGAGVLPGWEVYVDAAGKLAARVCQDFGATQYRGAAGSTVLALDTWYCAAFVYAGSSGDWTLYLNGVAETPTAAGAAGAWDADTATVAALGMRDPLGTPGEALTGAIGEVVVYKRAITAAEAAQIYAAGSTYYDRSMCKGDVVIEGHVQNRLGALVPAHHVRAGWWIQNLETGSGKPLYITGHSVALADKVNALTIGQDWMEDEIGVRSSELLAIPATVIEDAPEDEYVDEYMDEDEAGSLSSLHDPHEQHDPGQGGGRPRRRRKRK